MSGGSRAIECSLRAIRGKEDGFNQLISGFLAGFSFLLNGSLEIAMYVGSKAGESLFYHLVNRGYLVSLPYGEVIAFALACGVMFSVSLYEPHNLRPSYLKFSYPSICWKICNHCQSICTNQRRAWYSKYGRLP